MGAIDYVTREAFLNAVHSDHNEQYILRALRADQALTISLVADASGQLLGHIAISPVLVADGSNGWYGLGPVSVLPQFQRRGIGSRLVTGGLEALERTGAAGCVVLGDPVFYRRFGFGRVTGLVLPGVAEEYFQALAFGDTTPQGQVAYHPAFSASG